MNNRICFYTPPYPRVKNYFDMIDTAKEHGLSAVEGLSTMDFATPDISAAKKVREYADSKNVSIPCFSVFINLIEQSGENAIEKLKGYAEIAKILGSPYLHHTIVPEARYPEKVLTNKDENFKKGIASVRKVYDFCEELGIKAIYEPQGFVFNGVENFKRFLSEIERDVKLVADFGNIFQSGDTINAFIEAFHDKIVHAHIKDVILSDLDLNGDLSRNLKGGFVSEVEIGKGELDIRGIITLLESYGYTGYYGLEYGVSDDNSKGITDSLDIVNSALI